MPPVSLFQLTGNAIKLAKRYTSHAMETVPTTHIFVTIDVMIQKCFFVVSLPALRIQPTTKTSIVHVVMPAWTSALLAMEHVKKECSNVMENVTTKKNSHVAVSAIQTHLTIIKHTDPVMKIVFITTKHVKNLVRTTSSYVAKSNVRVIQHGTWRHTEHARTNV